MQRALEDARFESRVRGEQHGLVEVLRDGKLVLHEPGDNRSGGELSFENALFGRERACGQRREGQRGDGLMLQQQAGAHLESGTTGAGRHLNRENGITAQLEEVLLASDIRDAEYL